MVSDTPAARLRRSLAAMRPSRGASISLAAALGVTALTLFFEWGVAPRVGLLRTVFPKTDFTGTPLLHGSTTEVSLAFLDEHEELPERSFSVRWQGFWYLHEPSTIDLHAGADDSVDVFVDSELVLRRNFKEGMHSTSRRLTLTEGSHEIIVRYRQHGGGKGLNVSWSTPGSAPAPLPADRLFAEPVDHRGLTRAAATRWLDGAMVLAWLVAGVLLVRDLRAGPRMLGRLRSGSAGGPQVFARRLALVAMPALLGPFLVFGVGAHTVYAGNPTEFPVAFREIVWPWVITVVGIAWALLLAVGAFLSLLSDRLVRAYAALLLGIGLLLWAQGHLLVGDYGPLYGEALDLSVPFATGALEVALWAGVALLAVVFSSRISPLAPIVSGLFIGLQVIGAAVLMAGAAESARQDQEGWSLPPERLYELSPTRNVIHIVLDGFLSELFGEALAKDRSWFDRTYSGFVYFADHLGAFPTTRASMPAMLTGVAYRNEEPFDRFLHRTLDARSIASVLGGHGYAVRSISFHGREHPRSQAAGTRELVRYSIPTPYGSYEDYVRFTALQLFDLSLFRHAPRLVKPHVYNDQKWLWQSRYAGAGLQAQQPRTARPSNHAAFLDEFARRLTVGQDEAPAYTFIHVALPHPPVVLDAGCTFVDVKRLTRQSYAAQSRCALAIVGRLLDRLRALELYEPSAIVLTADHGWRLERGDHPLRGIKGPVGTLEHMALSAMPLLAVKAPGAVGPLRISMAPTAITDIPATIADLVQLPEGLFPGESAFRLDESARRPRTFAFHSWSNADWRRPYMDALHVFAVNGPVLDPSSWHYQEAIVDPDKRRRTSAEGR